MDSAIIRASLTAATLSGISNCLAQCITCFRSNPQIQSTGDILTILTTFVSAIRNDFDSNDTLRYVLFSLLVCPPNYLWQKWLEGRFPGYITEEASGKEKMPGEDGVGTGRDTGAGSMKKRMGNGGTSEKEAMTETSTPSHPAKAAGKAKRKLNMTNTSIKFLLDQTLAIPALAATTAAAAYLDARFHLRKDLANTLETHRTARLAAHLAKTHRRSLWYLFESQVQLLQLEPCIWFRDSPASTPTLYTWVQAWEQCCRWARFLEEQGVRPGELVGTYMGNSPEYMFNMLGLWALGAAPAMINCNLGGEGLVHCLRIAGSKVLVVDAEDEGCRERVEGVRERLEGELGMRVVVVDAVVKAAISKREVSRPGDEYRDGVTGTFPIFIFYTSGTTGFPKACPFETQRSYGLGGPRLRSTGLVPGHPASLLRAKRKPDVWYDCMPLYHGTGCTVAIGCLISGLTLAIGRKFSVRNFWPDIHDSGANAFVYVGETARYLLAAPPSKLDKGHKLKAMYGNGMRPDVWEKFQERFDVPCVNEFFNSTEGMLSMLNVCRGPFHAAHVGHHTGPQRWQLRDKIVTVEIDHETGGMWRDPTTGFARRTEYRVGGEVIVQCASEKEFVG
ncbi:hypothetical protein LTR32_005540, partial [Rachicladosporium monterosium]